VLAVLSEKKDYTSFFEDIYFSTTSSDLRDMIVQSQGATQETVNGDWYRGSAGLQLLQQIHRRSNVLDLAAMEKWLGQVDPTLQAVFASKGVARHIAYTQLHPKTYYSHEWPKDLSPEDLSQAKRDWGEKFLETVVGLPRELRDDLLFASDLRIEAKGTKTVDDLKLLDLLSKTADNVQTLGLENTTLLHAEAGITNFDYYASDQLELMANVVKGDEATIERLQEGDVTVVFVDATGDHNGALKSKSKLYATKSGRTLFFEINEPDDYGRSTTLLQQRSIRPATVVFSAHGDPGAIVNGTPRPEPGWDVIQDAYGTETLVQVEKIKPAHRLTNEFDPGASSSERYTHVSLEHIVRDIAGVMQDSRGIDDPTDAIGTRRIILNACSQARPVYAPGSYATLRESTIDIVARTVNDPRVRVYGRPDVLSTTGTDVGIKFNRWKEQADGGYEKVGPMQAVEVRVDPSGRLHERYIDEIILRREEKEAAHV
jgi:hypothetical protein